MKTIPLSQGMVAIVDDEDYAALSAFKWSASRSRGAFYAMRKSSSAGSKVSKHIKMHREIVNAQNDTLVDHVNHNGLDNRRSNLRICTNAQNCRNKRGHNKNSTTGYRGVFLDAETGKFFAKIRIDGVLKNLGRFKTPELASIAYLAANHRYFGEFGVSAV